MTGDLGDRCCLRGELKVDCDGISWLLYLAAVMVVMVQHLPT